LNFVYSLYPSKAVLCHRTPKATSKMTLVAWNSWKKGHACSLEQVSRKRSGGLAAAAEIGQRIF
jgi:hypothetical protein